MSISAARLHGDLSPALCGGHFSVCASWQRLKEAAEREGKSSDALVLKAIEDRVMASTSMTTTLPYDAWLKAWKEDGKKLNPIQGDVDSERESIFGSRGE